jgi:hypothetical protein
MESTKLNGWREATSDAIGALVVAGALGFEVRIYVKGGNRVLVAQEDRFGNGSKLWHLSISRTDRYPGWDEIKDARYTLLPLGFTFALLLPPPNEYVNVHPNCFHLWQIPEEYRV